MSDTMRQQRTRIGQAPVTTLAPPSAVGQPQAAPAVAAAPLTVAAGQPAVAPVQQTMPYMPHPDVQGVQPTFRRDDNDRRQPFRRDNDDFRRRYPYYYYPYYQPQVQYYYPQYVPPVITPPVATAYSCPLQRPNVCTQDYQPVCALNVYNQQLTYSNACNACADPSVQQYSGGACVAYPTYY